MKRRPQKVLAADEPDYPPIERRKFLGLVAAGTALAVGFPAVALGDEPDDALVFETLQLGSGYSLELSRSPDEASRRALGEVYDTLVEYIENNVTSDGLHNTVERQIYTDTLTTLLREAIDPGVVQDVVLLHNCRIVCPNRRPKTRGVRRKVP